MINVYGIKNCSTVKKAIDWLDAHGIAYTFHDFKKNPATNDKLVAWEKYTSWELLLNKKGTTWRKLTPEQQASAVDADSANTLLIENNSMIKRPIIEWHNDIILGFDEELYAKKLLK